MASRGAGRSRARNDDSQLDFLTLVFQGGGAKTPGPELSAALAKEPSSAKSQLDAPRLPESKLESVRLDNESIAPPRPPLVDGAAKRLEPVRNERNYRIKDSDLIGSGSLKAKCRGNLAAIEVLKLVEAQERQATKEEKGVLVRYVGWGGLPQVFDCLNDEWQTERNELERLLTESELDSARATTLNAHYTAPVVIQAMYSVLARFGFEHGRILEPACGIGHFIGLMPEAMLSHSQITGVEIDSVSARITEALYPDSDIRHSAFEETKLADNFYDVAVSNIPFGDYKPYDPKFRAWNFPIHDYFFAASLEKVRPGGLLLFITSKGTLDKQDGAIREYIASRADLLGAIRLPNDAFKKNANTEVTTDIVMLQ
jgi:adenine-specific DNA methylase